MSKREELQAALAGAETELAHAVADRARADADMLNADAGLDKVRARCRHARAALAELNRAEETVASAKRTDGEESAGGSKPRSSPRPAPGDLARDTEPSKKRPRKTIHRLIGGFPVRALGAGLAPGRRFFSRQSLMLLALVSAYLQYYFFDVNLQIVRLPTITVPLFS